MPFDTPQSRATGFLVTAATWNQDVVTNVTELADGAVTIPFDGAGVNISTDSYVYFPIPFKLKFTAAEMQADNTGSIVIDLWHLATSSDWTSNRPANSDSITASAPPTLSSDAYSIDSTLTGWTTTLTAGGIKARVESCSGITRCSLTLHWSRSS